MYIVHSTFIVPEGKSEEVIEIYRNRSQLVDQWPGFISFQLLQNDRKPGEITVQITWHSKQDYMNWVTSEHFKEIHELEKRYPDQELANIRPSIKKYQVVAR